MSSYSIPAFQQLPEYPPFATPVRGPNAPIRTTAGLNDAPWLNPDNREPDRKTITEYLTIHSSDRDRTAYPAAGKFVVRLADSSRGSLTRVKSVRLVGGILPDVGGTVIQEPYLLLVIPELSNGHMRGNNALVENAFALLQLDRPLQNDAYLSLRGDFNCMSQVAPSSSTINQLSISILKTDGTVFDFSNGSRDDGATADQTKNLSLFFEVKRDV